MVKREEKASRSCNTTQKLRRTEKQGTLVKLKCKTLHSDQKSAILCVFTDLNLILVSTFLPEQKKNRRVRVNGGIKSYQNNAHP